LFNAASIAARQARFEQGENGSMCYEQMAGFLQEQEDETLNRMFLTKPLDAGLLSNAEAIRCTLARS
jgi:hypothetical protein